MTTPFGAFVWYDLMTPDPSAARAFYAAVLGWSVVPSVDPTMKYDTFAVGRTPVAGLMATTEEARARNVPPCWTGYIGVDDVDAAVARIVGLGGSVLVPAMDVPLICRFAVVADPWGAVFAVFRWAGESPGEAPPMGTPGFAAWRELAADDWEVAFPFYASVFGWEKGNAVDIGPMGTYQLITLAGQEIGGVFNRPEGCPGPFWMYYFAVEDIDAGANRVTENGGAILYGPMAVPGGGWIVQCTDTQGAAFALFGERAG